MPIQDNVALGAFLLRAALGVMWISHGLLKVLVFGLPGTAAFFAGAGFWPWLAYPVVAAELLGGSLILLGIGDRIVSLALLPILAGAALTHLPNGWVFSAPGGGWEYPAFLALASLVHGLLGDGAWAFRPAIFSLPVSRPSYS